jgi:hypothetical protein
MSNLNPGNGATQSSDVSSANKVAPSTFVDPNTIRDVEAQPQMVPEGAPAAGMLEYLDGILESLDDTCTPINGATQSSDVSSANKVAPSTFVDPNTIRDVEAQPQMAAVSTRASTLLENPDELGRAATGGVCSGCGAEMRTGARFCTSCGKSNHDENPVPATTAITSSPGVVRVQGVVLQAGGKESPYTGINGGIEVLPAGLPAESIAATTTGQEGAFCTGCGAKMKSGARFCTGCGAKRT